MHCIGKGNFVYWCFLLFIFFVCFLLTCAYTGGWGVNKLFQHWNQAGGLKKKVLKFSRGVVHVALIRYVTENTLLPPQI